MEILITGVAGLIGSNIADYILMNNININIIGIDNLSGGYIEHVDPKITFYNLNLLNFKSIEEIFIKHNISKIIHCAAYAAEGLSPFIRVFNFQENTVATTHLINMAIKYNINKFIFTSSMAVYGCSNPPFDENDIPFPVDPYGIAKYASELDLQSAYHQFGLNYVIIRPHNVYGQKQNIWDKYRNVIGIWLNRIREGKSITIYGDGEQERSFSYIKDFIPPFYKSIFDDNIKNTIINLGSKNNITINKLAQLVRQITNQDYQNIKIEYFEPRNEVKFAYSTHLKSIELLNYSENYSLEEGIKEMWEWVKKQPFRKIQKIDTYEINKNIYSYWQLSNNC